MAKKKIVVETKYTAKGAENVEKSYKDIGKSANKASKETDSVNASATAMGGAMGGAMGKVGLLFTSIKTGVTSAVLSFRTLSGAIASTGIGLLVVAFASLTAFFTKTERGAEKLNVIMSVLGTVFDKMLDVIIHLGEALFSLFENPVQSIKDLGKAIKTNLTNRLEGVFKIAKALGKVFSGDITQGLKDLGEASLQTATGVEDVTGKISNLSDTVGEFASEVVKTAEASSELATSLNKLERAERDFGVANAKANLEREKLLTISKDQTKSDKERLDSLKEASAIDKKRVEDEVKLAEERFRIIKSQNALAESGQADLKKQADAEQKVFDLRTRFFRTQQRLISQQSSLENTIQKKREAIAKKQEVAEKKRIAQAEKDSIKLLAIEQKRIDLSIELQDEGVDKQIAVIENNAEKRREALRKEGVLTIELEKDLAQQTADQVQAVKDDAEAKKKALDKQNSEDAIKLAQDTAKQKEDIEQALNGAILNFANSLSSALGEESKTALAIQKTVALAQIGIDTAKAISSLVANSSANPSNAVTFGGAGAIQLATGLLTIGSNIAQAYKILKRPAPSIKGGSSGGGSAPAPTTAQTSPDLGFQGTSAGVEQFGAQTVIKAFVTESDITNSQTNANNIQQLSQIG